MVAAVGFGRVVVAAACSASGELVVVVWWRCNVSADLALDGLVVVVVLQRVGSFGLRRVGGVAMAVTHSGLDELVVVVL